MADWSTTWTWFDGRWVEGNAPIVGPRANGWWLGSTVFDGGRAFEGVTPDLDLHCQRVNRSARALNLEPTMRWEEMVELTAEGLKRFAPDAQLYIRPMYWAEQGGLYSVVPNSTRFCLCLYESPLPQPTGFSIMLSRLRKPSVDSATTDAKTGSLYPNNARAMQEARAAGFENALMCDPNGNVAELATANIFMVKDGVVLTPVPNGTFLAGITRFRTMALLRGAGFTVDERTLAPGDFLMADEIFSTSNYFKLLPVTRIEDRALQPGPVYARARELYWDYAHS